MAPLTVVLLLIALALSGMLFRLLLQFNLHWSACLLCAAVPLVATFFCGFFGLLAAAFVTGLVYKASP